MGRTKGKMAKATGDLIFQAKEILVEYRPTPMTLRQLYYQLVSRGFVKNNAAEYRKLSKAIVTARQNGIIPWDWIEDRMRKPRYVSMWSGMNQFGISVLRAYRLNVWSSQPQYVEVWLEKDALSGIFEDILEPYGVTLNVGRGYDGWTSIKDAARRYKEIGKPVSILYFGDFDPSGEDMNKSLEERLNFFKGFTATIDKVAILKDDIEKYDLPPALAKKTDTRYEQFIEAQGDAKTVELDALPINVLTSRIKTEVEANLDMAALGALLETESEQRATLEQMFRDQNAATA